MFHQHWRERQQQERQCHTNTQKYKHRHGYSPGLRERKPQSGTHEGCGAGAGNHCRQHTGEKRGFIAATGGQAVAHPHEAGTKFIDSGQAQANDKKQEHQQSHKPRGL